ncbi:Chromosome-partitioning protein Spo0J [compost metagenome]
MTPSQDPSLATSAAGRLLAIPLETIDPNPRQPRLSVDPDELAELAASIRHGGLDYPIKVRPHPELPGRYQVSDGERRLRAYRLNREAEPADPRWQAIPAVSSEMSDAEMGLIAFRTAFQRSSYGPVGIAKQLRALIDLDQLDREEVARAIGKSVDFVNRKMALLHRMPEALLDAVERGTLSEGHALSLKAVSDGALRKRLLDGCVRGSWSRQDLRDRIAMLEAVAESPYLTDDEREQFVAQIFRGAIAKAELDAELEAIRQEETGSTWGALEPIYQRLSAKQRRELLRFLWENAPKELRVQTALQLEELRRRK